MKRLITTLLTTLTITVCASPIPDFPFIAVTGKASDKIPPDTVAIKFTVLVHSKKSDTATNGLNSTLNDLTDKIVDLGIPKESITADDLSKRAVRQHLEAFTELNILGYDAWREVKVELGDLKLYTPLIRLIMKTDNVKTVSSHFDTVNRTNLELELVERACADAKHKALILSRGVGAVLGDVFAVSDEDFSTLDDRFGFGYVGGIAGAGSPGNTPSDAPVFIPATIDIYASVEVLYRLGNSSK